jgi:hypothetical protein
MLSLAEILKDLGKDELEIAVAINDINKQKEKDKQKE